MKDWVTIFITTDALRVSLAQSLLEAEGIPTFFKGEAMGTIGQMYGGAMGANELQVPVEEEGRARILLMQAGMLRPRPVEAPGWLERLDTITKGIPLLGRMPAVIRLFIPFALLILLIISLVLLYG